MYGSFYRQSQYATILESYMTKFLIIFVIYRKKISEVTPLKYFDNIDSEEFEFFIYDNSPEPLENIINLRHKFKYVLDYENSGVSRAYNLAAEYARSESIKWLILFDQDTKIKKGYFQSLELAIAQNPGIQLFAPRVYYSGGVMSPKLCKYFRPSSSDLNIGLHFLKDAAIINSGLIVSTHAFWMCGGYNEELRLDFADYQFIERIQSKIKQFYVFPGELYQDFSNDETDARKLFTRFVFYCEGLKKYKTTPLRHLMLIYTGFLHTMALVRRTKSFKFLPYYFKCMLK